MASKYFISCWYLSDYESDAMWKLYGGSNNCIAVRSTTAKLKESLPTHTMVAMVNYIDYETQSFPTFNLFENVIHKRRSFEHERELRAIVGAASLINADMPLRNDLGYFPKVDLGALIACIYVHPLADDWFLNTVGKLVETAGQTIEVRRSDLAAVPTF